MSGRQGILCESIQPKQGIGKTIEFDSVASEISYNPLPQKQKTPFLYFQEMGSDSLQDITFLRARAFGEPNSVGIIAK